jgi:hypothetical protein
MVRHTGSSLIDEMGTARRPWMDPLESIISSSKSSPELSGRLSMTNCRIDQFGVKSLFHNITCSKEAYEQKIR